MLFLLFNVPNRNSVGFHGSPELPLRQIKYEISFDPWYNYFSLEIVAGLPKHQAKIMDETAYSLMFLRKRERYDNDLFTYIDRYVVF